MKTEIQRFNDFKKRHNLSYRDIAEIATEYAETADDRARTYFSEKYYFSESVFYKIRDFAIICHLVDDKTCNKIRDKASRNNASHNEENSAISSYKHFDDLLLRRKDFLSSFSNEEITVIAYKYIEGIDLRIISDIFEICEESVKKLIKKGIEEVILSTSNVRDIERKMKKEGKNLKLLNKMEQVREQNRLQKLEPLYMEMKVIRNQISNYDSYFLGDEIIPEKDFLINRLNEVEKKYQKILEF